MMNTVIVCCEKPFARFFFRSHFPVRQEHKLSLVLFMVTCLSVTLPAQKMMESINRGVVAVRTSSDHVYVGWRLLGTDPAGISFNIYRSGVKISPNPVTGSTNFVDTIPVDGTYFIRPVINGVEATASDTVSVWSQNYLEVQLQRPAGDTLDGISYTYSPNDCSVGDLDGDGEYEIVVKWDPSNAKDNSHSGYTGRVFLDAYELDGTRLWRIDLGWNIRAGAHYTQFIVYDLDSDGKAEVACKTADGTVDGQGNVIGDDSVDYRNPGGYVLNGPEFLTVFSGVTGEALATVDYVPARGSVSSWGDNYGNRVDRFLAGVGYFDGQYPSLLMCRGYYTRSVLAAWDWRNGELTQKWIFDTDNGYPTYTGQGAHSLSVGDADSDGKDEVMYGAMAVDDNGAPMYNTQFNHGDATHLGDLIPSRPGLEFYMPSESAGSDWDGVLNPGIHVRDAGTGEMIWSAPSSGDVGRALTADITADHPGNEFWATHGVGMYNSSGTYIGSAMPSVNFAIWWDADPLRELLNGARVDKWNGNGTTNLLDASGAGAVSNNGSKSTPSLTADLLGDWREEVVWRHDSNERLLIFTTTDVTDRRMHTLMHDPQYRVAVAWQNTGYNQPPHPGFFIGDSMSTPPSPDIEVVRRPCTSSIITPYLQVNDGVPLQAVATTINAGDEVRFGPAPVAGGLWSWSGCGTSGATRVQNSSPQSTCTATATHVSMEGCVSVLEIGITVDELVTALAQSTDGEKIRFYPNPASRILHLELLDRQPATVRIFDASGKLMLTGALSETKNRIDMSDLQEGIYLLEVNTSSGSIRSRVILNDPGGTK